MATQTTKLSSDDQGAFRTDNTRLPRAAAARTVRARWDAGYAASDSIGTIFKVCARAPLAYTGMMQAIAAIWREEGIRGFSRGMQARMLIHAPSVAICWATYESVKGALQRVGYF